MSRDIWAELALASVREKKEEKKDKKRIQPNKRPNENIPY
jgi:hypothetical protein